MAVDSAPSANTYTVKKGDNLSRIAKKYYTPSFKHIWTFPIYEENVIYHKKKKNESYETKIPINSWRYIQRNKGIEYKI